MIQTLSSPPCLSSSKSLNQTNTKSRPVTTTHPFKRQAIKSITLFTIGTLFSILLDHISISQHQQLHTSQYHTSRYQHTTTTTTTPKTSPFLLGLTSLLIGTISTHLNTTLRTPQPETPHLLRFLSAILGTLLLTQKLSSQAEHANQAAGGGGGGSGVNLNASVCVLTLACGIWGLFDGSFGGGVAGVCVAGVFGGFGTGSGGGEGGEGTSIDTSAQQLADLQDLLNKVENWTTLAVSIFQLFLLGLVIYLEYRVYLTLKRVFSPVNVSLFSMILFNSLGLNLFDSIPLTADIPTFLNYFYAAIVSSTFYEISLIFYSWSRGYPVIKAILPSWTLPTLRIYIALYILAICSQNGTLIALEIVAFTSDPVDVPTYKLLKTSYNNLYQIAASLFLAFDIFVLLCYTWYVTVTSHHGDSALVKRLTMLSWFGVVSCVWFVGWQACGLVQYYVPGIPVVDRAYLNIVFNLAPLLNGFVQIGMKWVLFVGREAVEGSVKSGESAGRGGKRGRVSLDTWRFGFGSRQQTGSEGTVESARGRKSLRESKD
ncbi:hypothetical protein HDU79_004390 [Rhizoclosmatium sp. JEL0117]|nr:hypothetical protein HDU79_004390 [Rhizoclosmatium sp. JEL0117]